MKIHMNLDGRKRKELAAAVGELMGVLSHCRVR